MNFIEFVTFVFTMVALFYLSFRQAKEQKKQVDEMPEEALLEEQKQIREMLRSLDIPVEEPKKRKQQKIVPSTPKQPEVELVASTLGFRKNDHQNIYKIVEKKSPRQKLPSLLQGGNTALREAVLLREILGPPKGL